MWPHYELWVALWYSEHVKRKAVYQHGSPVVEACHPCRQLTLFVAFLPVLAALSECMKHDRTCIVIWPFHCYDVLSGSWTIFVDQTCRGVKLEQHCLQNTQTEHPHTHIYKCTHTSVNLHTCIHEHKPQWQTHLLMYSWVSAPSPEMIYF